MPYDVSSIRQKLKKQMGGFADPDEFKPPKVDPGETKQFRFYILPPILAGDELKSGTVERAMEMFYIQHGNHWINNKPHPCPRVFNNEKCPICQQGFDFLKQPNIKEDEVKRKKIISEWMPNTYYMVNIFFSNSKQNPEDLRGRVKFYNAPKTCFDLWSEALMREDAGDAEDPRAYGVFFDENNAFQFQLEVTKSGRNNSYKTSKFLANGGNPSPIAKDTDTIAKIMRLRHNLFDKIEMPDVDKLEKLQRQLIHGDDDDDVVSGGFDEDETSTSVAVKEEVVKDAPTTSSSTNNGDDGVVDGVSGASDSVVDDEPVSKPETKSPPSSEADEEVDDELDALLSSIEDE